MLEFAKVAGHHIITWLVIGAIAGALAGKVMRGTGFGLVRDMIVGLVGAVIGGLALHAVVGTHTSTSSSLDWSLPSWVRWCSSLSSVRSAHVNGAI